jgi:hypothetical protein
VFNHVCYNSITAIVEAARHAQCERLARQRARCRCVSAEPLPSTIDRLAEIGSPGSGREAARLPSTAAAVQIRSDQP